MGKKKGYPVRQVLELLAAVRESESSPPPFSPMPASATEVAVAVVAASFVFCTEQPTNSEC